MPSFHRPARRPPDFMAIPPAVRGLIAERDKRRCVYCLTTEENCGLRMHVDHIIPEIAGGPSTSDNVCLACFSCNVCKAAQQTAIDPLTGETVPLFHPVHQQWRTHFTWDESQTQIVGLTSCGRATVAALHMNNPTVVRARRRWVSAGWHPPDP
jgi:hypothetical protein